MYKFCKSIEPYVKIFHTGNFGDPIKATDEDSQKQERIWFKCKPPA